MTNWPAGRDMKYRWLVVYFPALVEYRLKAEVQKDHIICLKSIKIWQNQVFSTEVYNNFCYHQRWTKRLPDLEKVLQIPKMFPPFLYSQTDNWQYSAQFKIPSSRYNRSESELSVLPLLFWGIKKSFLNLAASKLRHLLVCAAKMGLPTPATGTFFLEQRVPGFPSTEGCCHHLS